MKKGLELLNVNNNVINISRLEEINKLRLPPIYKMFAEHFILDEFSSEKYLTNKNSDFFQFTGVYYEPKGLGESNIGITGLYAIEKVFENYKTLQGYTDDDVEKGLIRIADIGLGGGIFVGTKEVDIDKIILHLWDREPEYETLSDNIFEFMQGMKSIQVPEAELIEATYSQLYKNYGEDFWRIRENNA